jgi:seryl-tRNA synthetase
MMAANGDFFMHDIKALSKDHHFLVEALKLRGHSLDILDEMLALYEDWKSLTTKTETAKSELNKLAQQIGQLKKEKNEGQAQALMGNVQQMKELLKVDEERLAHLQSKIDHCGLLIPNLVAEETPRGKSEEDNVVVKQVGTIPHFSYSPKDHGEIGSNLGLLDFEVASKITGSRFSLYKGDLCALERAISSFMLNDHIQHGYLEIIPSVIVHEKSLIGSGQLPKFADDLFKLEGRDWYLSPTAEVPLVNMKRDELFPQEELPLKYCALTPCFRSEAGSYGKDTKGLIRLHQFHKVELVQIVSQEESEAAFQGMVQRASSILDQLELPYRQLALCSGDLGFASLKTIDLEVWLPGQQAYREISSISHCGDFQSRRASIRYRGKEGRPVFAHTLNGSGLAVGRTLVAILENYQQEDGTVKIPKVLQPYMNGKVILNSLKKSTAKI